jgi:putative ABC transport system permease protein
VRLPAAGYAEPDAVGRVWDEALRRIREVPGVLEVGLTTSLPPDNYGDSNNFDLVDRPVAPGSAEPTAPWAWVTPGFLPALGVPLVEGRLLQEGDTSEAAPAVLVSRAWAERHLPGERAVGQRLYAGGCRECTPLTIVGVVGDVKYEGLAGSGIAVYEPVRPSPGSALYLVVRTTVPPTTVVGSIRERLHASIPASRCATSRRWRSGSPRPSPTRAG